MGKSTSRKTKQVRDIKRIKANDNRLKVHQTSEAKHKQIAKEGGKAVAAKNGANVRKVDGDAVVHASRISAAMFLKYNTQLGPPYRVLIDTNFINFSIQHKLDIFTSLMDCLLAKVIPILTDCVVAELEKLGLQYRVALRLSKDERFERYPCSHKGVYADDCLIDRVTNHKCFMVATCDRELKRRIRKIPGVPIVYITGHKYQIERFADVTSTPP